MEMEPCDPGPERAMRQYLTQLLETGTSRSTGCLDRFVKKGMSNFPPPSSLEGKASRCSLFEQLLSGGSRKSERLLVPDLATEWFRKQKVFLDKLSPEELAALSDGLADKDSKKSGQKQSSSSTPCRQQQQASKSGASSPVASQMKDAEECGGKVAACIPTTETRGGNGNPFLIGNAQTEEMQSKSPKRRRFHWERHGHRCPSRRGSCSCLKRREGSSLDCLFQADGQPMASDCLDALRTEPLLPCLRRKFDLRQAPQRRLDPARFRRISPEFFRILASYEAAMSESCPLYGISMHHWGDTEAYCPCGERHPNLKHRFLGDDTVATTVLPPAWSPFESRQTEDLKQPAKKTAEKKGSKSLKEKSEKLKKNYCINDSCTNDSCLVTKETRTEFKVESTTFEDERQKQRRTKRLDKQQNKADDQEVRQVDSGQTFQSSSFSENSNSERWQGRRGDQKDRKQTNPERRRRFPNCFRRQSQSYRTAYVPTSFSPPPSYPSALPVPANPTASSPVYSPTSSTAHSPEMPRKCQCRHQPRGILSGFTGICKRCIEPGRHLLYNLNVNYQQNRERYGQMRQNKKRQKEDRGTSMPFHLASQPAPCSWKKSKGDWNDRFEEGTSSTTLKPESFSDNGFQNCHPDSEVIREQAYSEQSLTFRTPASERTLAGWNQVQQEQPQLKATQCHPDCKWALPQESYQLPPVSNCTFALAEAQQEVLQSSEVTRKSNSKVDNSKCGHRTRACYLANDFHQLMKRVAKKRPNPKQGSSRSSRSSPVSTTKASNRTKDQGGAASGTEASSEQSKAQAESHSKPIIMPKSKPRIIGTLLPDEFNAKGLNITSSATTKLRSLGRVKKKKQDHEPGRETPPAKGSSSLSLGRSQVENAAPSAMCQELPSTSKGENQAPYSSNPSCMQQDETTSPKGSSRGTSPNGQQEAKLSNPSPSKKRCQKRQSSCSSFERSQREHVLDASNISDPSSWTPKSGEPAKKREQKQRFQYNSTYPFNCDVYSSQYSRAWSRPDSQSQCRSSPLKSAMKKAPIQYQASLRRTAPSHLETGRRYYTDTQPGSQMSGSRCSCRSLRSTTSIRALSSNTDSVRCPCAPAPSVASVEPSHEVVNAEEEEQEDHCCCCRYHTHQPSQPLDASYLQTRSSPLPCACRRHKAMLFSDAMRWEPQQHHHARTLLRTQRPRPPPPPLKHQNLAMCPEYTQYHLENPPVQQTTEWAPEYQAPCHYTNDPNQRWEDQVDGSPYYTQNNYVMQNSPRNNSYSGQATYQEGTGRDRAGAIRAAAQGLKGVVKALGGTRPRSGHNPQLDYYHHRGYSQEQNPALSTRPYQNQMRGMLHSNDACHLQAQGAKNRINDFPLYRGPSTSTYYENYPLRNETTTSCNARGNTERDQSSFRMEGGGRQVAGASPLANEPKKMSNLSPLAIFFESLRAKRASSEIPSRNMQQSGAEQTPIHDNDSDTIQSSSDDDADADDSLDWRHGQLRRPSEDTMVIPPTYTGLLEEQVLGEYLPSPRCKRRI